MGIFKITIGHESPHMFCFPMSRVPQFACIICYLSSKLYDVQPGRSIGFVGLEFLLAQELDLRHFVFDYPVLL
jgi:hypothetical protein